MADSLNKKSDITNNISVDCVIFGYAEDNLYVLLTQRALKDPKSGKVIFCDYTLQGHHILSGERIDDAARRVLKEKTGLDNIYLKQFYAFGDKSRTKHRNDQLWLKNTYPEVSEYVLTIAYYSLVDKTKVNPDDEHSFSSWFPIDQLPELGYDHKDIFDRALEALQAAVLREPVAFEMLPEKFTLLQVQRLYEAILGVKLDRRNFRKKINQMKYVIPLDEKQNGVPHTPAQYYIFSWDVYHKTKKEKYNISF